MGRRDNLYQKSQGKGVELTGEDTEPCGGEGGRSGGDIVLQEEQLSIHLHPRHPRIVVILLLLSSSFCYRSAFVIILSVWLVMVSFLPMAASRSSLAGYFGIYPEPYVREVP